MIKQKIWRLYYIPVSSHLKRFGNRIKIGLCTGENVPDPLLNAASAPRVFSLLQGHMIIKLTFTVLVNFSLPHGLLGHPIQDF